MPGQQLVAPHLTTDAVAAQTSPQARRRRSTRLMKTGSFCSLTSEGDGDIFNSEGTLRSTPEVASSSDEVAGAMSITNRGSSSSKFDPLSDYSELQDDACSDISDMFVYQQPPFSAANAASVTPFSAANAASVTLSAANAASAEEIPPRTPFDAQGTLSEAASIDDITYDVPTVVNLHKKAQDESQETVLTSAEQHFLFASEDIYGSSSCSLSIGSSADMENQVITVPVTIEHPPPELRQPRRQVPVPVPVQPSKAEASCQQATPASIAHHHQMRPNYVTARHHDSSGSSAATVVDYVTARRNDSSTVATVADVIQQEHNVEAMAVTGLESSLEPGMRMVLVRDIGIQVSGDSPNLNLARKFKSQHHHHHHRHHHASSTTASAAAAAPEMDTAVVHGGASGSSMSAIQHQDSLAEQFPAEILF